MTLSKSLYECMPEDEKAKYEDYCESLCMDAKSKHAQCMWYEFKKSGLTW